MSEIFITEAGYFQVYVTTEGEIRVREIKQAYLKSDASIASFSGEWGDVITVNEAVFYGKHSDVDTWIGYYDEDLAFVGVLEYAEDSPPTVSEDFEGKEIIIRSQAVGSPNIMVVYTDTGVTVEAPGVPVTFTIPANKWTAEHADDVAVGKRRVLVAADVVVPAGFILKLYSNTTPGGSANVSSAVLTPGVSYVTNGVMTVGTTCYNSIWQLRESDGAILPCSVDEKSFVIEEEVVPPDQPDVPAATIVVPGATESIRLSNLKATLDSWRGTGWSATSAALGLTDADERYIDLPAGNYGKWLYKSNSTSFAQKVHVRGQDKATMSTVFKQIGIENAGNLGFEFMQFILIGILTNSPTEIVPLAPGEDGFPTSLGAGDTSQVSFKASPNCFIRYCKVQGPLSRTVLSDTTINSVTPKPSPAIHGAKTDGINGNNSPNFEISDTLILAHSVGITLGTCHGYRVSNICFNLMKGDDLKLGNNSNGRLTDIWYSLSKEKFPGGDHTDFLQDQTNPRGEIVPWPVITDVVHQRAMIYQKMPGTRSYQGIFYGGEAYFQNHHVVDSFLACSNGNVKFPIASKGHASNSVTWCSGMFSAPQRAENGLAMGNGYLDTMGGTRHHNIVAHIHDKTADHGGGANSQPGIQIDCGTFASQQYQNQHVYYNGPIQSAASSSSPIKEIWPKVGTRAHWTYTPADDRVGWCKFAERIAAGLHPGNSLNPLLAQFWHDNWNWDGFITS